ncbi:MATE family efflux transporter [Gracilibacillus sp. YIM 98692]|uniref:MATE family efflux transporter n=1 Tax=Gracilibacillus sp. YIM 98692 TaxID=2663532 RepID=UPI0013D880E6|nr:MATE family efflux transporter [Gracilibacillus sp. YIM 98692]
MDRQRKKLTLFALTWPIFIEISLHMLMGNADTLMLSQYADHAVAAVGVSNQILSVIIVMFGFVSLGTSIIIAQYLGASNEKAAIEVVTISLIANFIFGLVVSVLFLFFSHPILSMMNLSADVLDSAKFYLRMVGSFLFLQSIIMTIGATIRSYGFTKDAMYITLGMNIINVIGNYLFIFGPFGFPVLGVEGVAISTAVSRGIGVIALLLGLLKRIDHTLTLGKQYRNHLKKLLFIGIPSAGEQLAYNGSQMAITYFITMLGTEAITTKIYTQNISMFIFLFTIAISQGTQILVSHLVGAKEREKAYYRCLRSLKIAIYISLTITVIFTIFSDFLFQIFTTNEKIVSMGGMLLLLTILLEPGRSLNIVVIHSLRAAGDVRFPVYTGVLSMWGISVLLTYILGIELEFGLVGVWFAMIADEWIRGVIMLLRWRSRRWQHMNLISQKK